jgi:hypothetical protein
MVSQKRLRKMAAVGADGGRQIEQRLVPDPMMTDAEYFERRRVRPGPNVGKVSADINMVELIGGLARVKNRTPLQEVAAARFRLLHERAHLSSARTMDYTAVRVDVSARSGGGAAEHGEQARRDYRAAVRHLGMLASSIVERVVIYDMSLREVAGGGGRASVLAGEALRQALDDLAVHFKLVSKPVS